MATVTRFVGLDYHQHSIQVCIMDESGTVLANRKLANLAADIRTLVQNTFPDEPAGLPVVRVSLEACSGAAHLADELMQHSTWLATLAHPGIVNRMKQNPDKSDKADAWILADLLRLNYLPRVWLAPDEIRQLRQLVRHRAKHVKEKTRVKLRIRALLREQRLANPAGLRPWTKRWMAWLRDLPLNETDTYLRDDHLEEYERLTRKIQEVEQLLAGRVKNDAVVDHLLTLNGIGFVTAVTMRAEIGRFDRFDSGKQLSRYCGVTPRNASSGQKQADAGLVKAGNTGLRMVLVQAAQRLMNFDDHWRAFAARMKKKGKVHNVIVAAVANRWMRRLYHEMQPENLMAG